MGVRRREGERESEGVRRREGERESEGVRTREGRECGRDEGSVITRQLVLECPYKSCFGVESG